MMDQVADLLTRIKNAILAGKDVLSIPHSKMKEAVLQILKNQNFIKDFESNLAERTILVTLSRENSPTHLKKISKPGRRIYVGSRDIPKPLRGLGLVILSTPKGVISGWEASKQGIGGELICEIW